MPLRSRSRGVISPTSTSWQYTRHGPTSPSWYAGYTTWSATSANVGEDGTYESMTDVIQSGYRRRGSPDTWVNNPMSQSLSERTAAIQQHKLTCAANANGQYLSCMFSGDQMSVYLGRITPATSLFDPATIVNLAKIRTLAKIEKPQMLVGVSLAESAKSARLVLDKAKEIAHFMSLLKRPKLLAESVFGPSRRKIRTKYVYVYEPGHNLALGVNHKPMRFGEEVWSVRKVLTENLSEAARRWLEYRLGWTPLVSDFVGLLKAFYAEELREQLIKREVKRVSHQEEKQMVNSINTVLAASGREFTYNTLVEQSIVVKGYVYYEVTKDVSVNDTVIRRAHDFGLWSVPSTMWELVPYSFLVDRVIPIGDWLEAAEPRWGVKVLQSGVVTTRELKKTRTLTGYRNLGSSAATGDNFPAAGSPVLLGSQDSHKEYQKDRTVGLSLPAFPPVVPDFDRKQIADVLALAVGHIRGFGSFYRR